jgi:hypothetical protein
MALCSGPVRSFEALGAEHVARWIRNTDGQWFDAANWDIGQWPDNAGTEVFDVVQCDDHGAERGQFNLLIVQNKLRLRGALKVQIAIGVEDEIPAQ